MKKSTLISGAVVVALAAGGAWWWTQRSSADAVQNRTAKIERGPLQATVSASGPAKPASGTTTGGWRWLSEAVAQPAGGGGGGLAAMRERLVTELNLTLG